jgi:hypothetical protein
MPYFIKGRSIDFYFLEKEFSRQVFSGTPQVAKEYLCCFHVVMCFLGCQNVVKCADTHFF